MKIAFLGTGNMGSALIQGAIRAKIVRARDITAYDVRPEALAPLKRKLGIKTSKTAAQAIEKAGFVFLCVKPQQMKDLLSQISGQVRPGQCLISIAAGVPSGKIEKALEPKKVPVVRVMPNTPALIGKGASALCSGRHAKTSHLGFAKRFFSAVGKAVILTEDHFDAVTAISGSGPAYVFYLAESFQKACQALGLPAKESEILFKQTLLGAAGMIENGEAPEELRRKVTSPGGTTEAALKHLESQNWQGIFTEAVRKAKERSQELSL